MKRAPNYTLVSILVILLVSLLAIAAYFIWRPEPLKTQTPTVNDFASCAAAGNSVMESYPRQCRDSVTGKSYTEVIKNDAAPGTQQFTSTKGVAVELNDWTENQLISNPLTLSGRVPGSWSFEAQFPVVLKDVNGTEIAQGVAHLNGDWMTDAMVSFSATLEFAKPADSLTGKLVLQKSNPSDLQQNADSVSIPVRFQ